MSLATRCPVCQTVFRVVQDQLKVSEGWVRCGRCAKVFNAFEGLFDLEREFPALREPGAIASSTPSQRVLEDLARRNPRPQPGQPWDEGFDSRPAGRDAAGGTEPPLRMPGAAPSPSWPAAPMAATAPSAAPPAPWTPKARPTPAVPAEPPAAAWPAAPSIAATSAPTTSAPATSATAPAPSASPAEPARPTPPAPHTPPDLEIREQPAPLPGEEAAAADEAEESFDALFHSDGELSPPTEGNVDIMVDDVEPAALDDAVDSRLLTFVQQADRAERWRQPWVRTTMAVATLLLALLLAAQIAIVRRDAVVAHWPQTRELMQALCAPLECRIEPLRRIEQISVDSSGLTRIDDGPVYRLALVLRNRTDTPLLTPSIDLSLTDASGALVSRRMLNAAELGSARTTIGAGQELALQALLMSAERPLTGYTIEIFYP